MTNMFLYREMNITNRLIISLHYKRIFDYFSHHVSDVQLNTGMKNIDCILADQRTHTVCVLLFASANSLLVHQRSCFAIQYMFGSGWPTVITYPLLENILSIKAVHNQKIYYLLGLYTIIKYIIYQGCTQLENILSIRAVHNQKMLLHCLLQYTFIETSIIVHY